MKRIAISLLFLLPGSAANAQSLVGDWYGPQRHFRLHGDARYESTSSIEASLGGSCSTRIVEQSSGSWVVRGASLTLDRSEGAIEKVDTCSGERARKELGPERETLDIRLEDGVTVLVLEDERYRRRGGESMGDPGGTGLRGVPEEGRSVPPGAPGFDLSGTWLDGSGAPIEIVHSGDRLQLRLPNGYVFGATGDGQQFKSHDMNASCNIDRLAGDRLRFFCGNGDFVVTRRR